MTLAFHVPALPLTRGRAARAHTPTCSITAPERANAAAKGAKLPPGKRHFLHVDDLSSAELTETLAQAVAMKQRDVLNDTAWTPLLGKAMAMVFAKPSSRTRVSFETAMFKAGGHALCLGPEVGVNTREAANDVARVLAGMTDVVMARLFAHDDIVDMAEVASVPVINGLTDYNHPCQIVADAQTIIETRGSLEGAKVVYVGDGNNIVHSWLELAARIGIDFTCACPPGYEPDARLTDAARAAGVSEVRISHEPLDAVRGADFVYSDVWASMGQKEEIAERERAFKGFQVDAAMMRLTDGGKFLHCLPAERGRECTDEVMEADYSVVFQQAENRMHAQLAVMLRCMGVDPGL